MMSGTDLAWTYAALRTLAVKATTQTVTLGENADSYVLSSSPYANYGKTTNLTASRSLNGSAGQALLRFDTSQVTGTLSSALLKFSATSWSYNSQYAQLQIRLLPDASDGWVEGSGGTNAATTGALTWNNRPQADGAAIVIAAGQWPKNGQFSVNVSSLLNQSLNTNRVATFVVDIVPATGIQATVNLASREFKTASLRPTLTLTSAANQAPTIAVAAKAGSSTVSGTGTSLTVLGADDGGETNLRYTWSATTVPSGASAPTFSVNGSNAAKSTAVLFTKAGSYGLKVTVTDAQGLSVTSTVTVTVVQTLSGLVVSPGSVAVQPGVTQTFAAAGLDQFGKVLATSPSITWSTTAGAISSSGVLTAPLVAGSLTVTATSGSVHGTATVSVTSVASFLGLGDAALASLTQSLFVDGSISRADMIQILRSVGADDGAVDAVEFADLQTILSNAATLKVASYVETLARDVVYGNTANAHYQGQTLGNLAAGSSATVLTRLVDKWFLGADHPGTPMGSYTLVSGTLLVNGPTHTDMYQGQLGDCYFISSLGSIADTSAAAIQNMFIDNGDNTWTVRFYYNGAADYVTVDRYLPASSGRLVFADYGFSTTSTSTELWIPLAEKAYAQWNETGKEGRDGQNHYSSIEGGWMADVYSQVLGKSASSYSLGYSSSYTTLVNAMTTGKAVTIGTVTSSKADDTLSFGLYGNHAYDVVSYNATSGTFTLYNPWGCYQPTSALTWAQLQTVCDWFATADPAGTTPISQVRSSLGALDQAYAALGQTASHARTAENLIATRHSAAGEQALLDLYYQQA